MSIHCLNLCGDWTQYKDKKCFKVLDIKAIQAEAVEKCVELNKDSSLVTIYDQEEQRFINELLVPFNNISMDAWIGMEYNGHEYDWMDGTDSNFTNWSEDTVRDGSELCVQMSLLNRTRGQWTDSSCKRPALIVCQKRQELNFNSLKDIIEDMIKTIDKQKVEFIVETKELIETNVKHEKEINSLNAVIDKVIEDYRLLIDKQNDDFNTKTQELENRINSLTEVIESQQKLMEKQTNDSNLEKQNLINEINVFIDEWNNYLNTKTEEFENKINTLTEVIENKEKLSQKQTNELKLKNEEQNKRIDSLIPLGFIYTQLPWQSAPHEFWPTMKWVDITRHYSGLFFRAEGGGSEPFGQTQQANQSWISNIVTGGYKPPKFMKFIFDIKVARLPETELGEWQKLYMNEALLDRIELFTTNGEVRPKNTAIRIWKRMK